MLQIQARRPARGKGILRTKAEANFDIGIVVAAGLTAAERRIETVITIQLQIHDIQASKKAQSIVYRQKAHYTYAQAGGRDFIALGLEVSAVSGVNGGLSFAIVTIENFSSHIPVELVTGS